MGTFSKGLMRIKLGLTLAGLLLAPVAAEAAYLYDFSASPHSSFGGVNAGTFKYESPTLLNRNTIFSQGDLKTCSSAQGSCSGEFYTNTANLGPGTDFADAINFNGYIYYFDNKALGKTGTYFGDFIGDRSAKLTITEFNNNVPNPLNIFDSVKIEIIGLSTMAATFSPSNGMSLSEAEDSLGFDHFNWIQVITEYDGLLLQPIKLPPFYAPVNLATPFLDPPNGGYKDHPADSLPYYWDENVGAEDGYHIDDNTIDDKFLYFTDTPQLNSEYTPQGGIMNFTTSLVGVRSGSEWVPLYTWDWSSNYRLGEGGIFGVSRSINGAGDGQGGILSYRILDNPTDVPPEIKSLWVQNGGIMPVPEPATWLLLIFGFGMIGSGMRSRHSNGTSAALDSPNLEDLVNHR